MIPNRCGEGAVHLRRKGQFTDLPEVIEQARLEQRFQQATFRIKQFLISNTLADTCVSYIETREVFEKEGPQVSVLLVTWVSLGTFWKSN